MTDEDAMSADAARCGCVVVGRRSVDPAGLGRSADGWLVGDPLVTDVPGDTTADLVGWFKGHRAAFAAAAGRRS